MARSGANVLDWPISHELAPYYDAAERKMGVASTSVSDCPRCRPTTIAKVIAAGEEVAITPTSVARWRQHPA